MGLQVQPPTAIAKASLMKKLPVIYTATKQKLKNPLWVRVFNGRNFAFGQVITCISLGGVSEVFAYY